MPRSRRPLRAPARRAPRARARVSPSRGRRSAIALVRVDGRHRCRSRHGCSSRSAVVARATAERSAERLPAAPRRCSRRSTSACRSARSSRSRDAGRARGDAPADRSTVVVSDTAQYYTGRRSADVRWRRPSVRRRRSRARSAASCRPLRRWPLRPLVAAAMPIVAGCVVLGARDGRRSASAAICSSRC